MSGVEGTEREDHDDGEAGVGQASGIVRALTTKDTKDHEGNLARWFDTWLRVCRIEL